MGFRVWKPATRVQPRSAICCPQRARGEPVLGERQVLGQGEHAHRARRRGCAAARADTRRRGGAGPRCRRRARASTSGSRTKTSVTSMTPHSRPEASRSATSALRLATAAACLVGHGEGEGQRPHRPVREAQALDDARVVGLPQEAREGARGARRRSARGRPARAGRARARGAIPRRRAAAAASAGDEAVHEHAAVGRHREERGRSGHDGKAPFLRASTAKTAERRRA